MKLGKYLELVGDEAIRSTAAGNTAADMIELVLQEKIDATVTGTAISPRISGLADGVKEMLLSKDLPAVGATARPTSFVGALLVTVLILADCFICAMIGWKFFTQDILPSEEMVTIVLGIPVAGIGIYYGIGTDKLIQALTDMALRRKSKE